MRRAAVVFLVSIWCAPLLAQSGGALELEVRNREARSLARALLNAWRLEYNAGDAGKVASLYLPDAYYLTQQDAKGIIHGRPAIQAYIQRGIDARHHIDEIRIVAAERQGDLMYVITSCEASNSGDKSLDVNLLVLRATGYNEWRIAAQEAAVPNLAIAIQSLE